MVFPSTRPLAVGLACAAAASSLLLAGAEASPAPRPAQRTAAAPGPVPGPLNAITDVPGILVGQVQSTRPPYLTGSTVLYTPDQPLAGVSVRGGSPGTWTTDTLAPTSANPGVDAIVLTGGSDWGMDVAVGAMHWLEDHKDITVPIVPGAVIWDIGRGGSDRARPTASWGYRAMQEAKGGPVRQGTVGAGTGALTALGTLKGGVGTASSVLDDGTVVGAVVVVNALGSTVDPKDCTLLGAALGIGGEFAGLRPPTPAQCKAFTRSLRAGSRGAARNTTIAIVATSAAMQNGALTRMASSAQDGLARAMIPSHTLSDGDTVFSVATGTGRQLSNDNGDDLAELTRIDAVAADTLSRAVAHAMLAATSVRTYKSYCDTFPSACAHLRREPSRTAPRGGTRSPHGLG
ncbi:P1 family peptidase [Streptomyces sp. HPF1205]|uniref:P1 family peptidase n=1 Tax=Streptomyces sp. HPF1205 TaxID=2873262 RepID=UPI001CEC5173|nr:P1 family peptidase [Streptomyces sp. HPF1205]